MRKQPNWTHFVPMPNVSGLKIIFTPRRPCGTNTWLFPAHASSLRRSCLACGTLFGRLWMSVIQWRYRESWLIGTLRVT